MYIKNRNIAVCIILSIVTCGIYGIYWYYKVVQESDVVTGNPTPMNPILVVILSYLTCGIYMWIWLYQCGSRFDGLNLREGRPSNNGILFLLLAIFGLAIVDWCLIQNELNLRTSNMQ